MVLVYACKPRLPQPSQSQDQNNLMHCCAFFHHFWLNFGMKLPQMHELNWGWTKFYLHDFIVFVLTVLIRAVQQPNVGKPTYTSSERSQLVHWVVVWHSQFSTFLCIYIYTCVRCISIQHVHIVYVLTMHIMMHICDSTWSTAHGWPAISSRSND